MHMVFALLCFVVVIHWLIFPYPSGLLHWHCGNLTITPVPAKQPWWIWINASCEFIMNDCITTTKQSTTKPCAYFLGYTVMGVIVQGYHSYQISDYIITYEHIAADTNVTSSWDIITRGKASHMTGCLWGKSTGHQWIPLKNFGTFLMFSMLASTDTTEMNTICTACVMWNNKTYTKCRVATITWRWNRYIQDLI